MRKNAVYIAFIALMLLLCLLPAVGTLLAGQTQAGGNQTLAAMPPLRDSDGNLNPDYLAELTAYVEDNYFPRQALLNVWSALNAKLLGTSIAEDVVLGREGWLYFSGTLGDYTGTGRLGEREIFCAGRNLALLSEYCAGKGARFLFTLAPNKNSLYPENMPPLTRDGLPTNGDALEMELAAQGVDYLDLFSVFRAQEEILYFPRDSHWNSKGAALAADALNRALGRESAYFQGPFTPAQSHQGDLYAMLYPTGEDMDTEQVYGGGLSYSYDLPVRGPDAMTIQTSGGGEGGLLMFRDSFGNLLYPYLADSFSTALFSRSVEYPLHLMEGRDISCVVVELVERNIPYLYQNVPQAPAPARVVPAAQPVEGTIQLSVEPAQSLPGMALVTGSLPPIRDTRSWVCVTAGENCYEAFLTEGDGFALYIPEDAVAAGGLSVLFSAGGQIVSVPAA